MFHIQKGVGILLAGMVLLLASPSVSQTVLTITNTTLNQSVELTEEDLLAFEQVEIRTENEFVDGIVTFRGPYARDVLASVSTVPEVYKMVAINDYVIEIPAEDFEKYDVIFAMFQDDERFSLRTKGPIWVIYPMSDHKELQDRTYNDRLIWQLTRVEFE